MPKRRTDDVVHVTMTDHLIQRQKPAGDLLAPKAELIESRRDTSGEVVPYYPAPLADNPENALYTAAAQVRDRRNLTEGLPRLANLLERYHPAQAGFYAELAPGLRRGGRLGEGESRISKRRRAGSTLRIAWSSWATRSCKTGSSHERKRCCGTPLAWPLTSLRGGPLWAGFFGNRTRALKRGWI